MELTARYGLEFNPFLKNSKEILFEDAEYTEGGRKIFCVYGKNSSLIRNRYV